jgi:ketosteroid isomerase-like protein
MIQHTRMTAVGAVSAALTLFAVGCGGPLTPPDLHAANEAAIRDADLAWSKAAAAQQVDQIVSYYADNASSFVDHGRIATGKDAIRGQWEELFMMGYSIAWQPTKVEVAQSGDLGYSQGTYEEKSTDSKGNTVANHGKYVVIWKKQPDGAWKAVSEIANAD